MYNQKSLSQQGVSKKAIQKLVALSRKKESSVSLVNIKTPNNK